MDHFCYLSFVFVMFSCLFIAALWSPTGRGLTSWLLCIVFEAKILPGRLRINEIRLYILQWIEWIVYLRTGWLWERSGSVVECLTRDRRAAGSSLTGVTALCP